MSESSKEKMRVAALRIASNPLERKRRSDRAKLQHLEGRIGKRIPIARKLTVCKVCGNNFYNTRKTNGKLSLSPTTTLDAIFTRATR